MANLRNGVLEIFMPKAASAEPRRIQVEYEDQ
jgi:HSP20 family molecular chaperone IbpA